MDRLHSSWTSSCIGNTCLVGDGAHASLKRQSMGVLYLTSKNIKDGRLDLSKVDYISQTDFAKHFRNDSKAVTIPSRDDVVFGIIGSIGEPYLVRRTDQFGISSSVAILRPNPDIITSEYLFQWVKSNLFQDALYGIKGGVAQGYVSLEMIRSLPLNYPPISAQRKIAAVLSAYDDLIENNTRRIQVLEEMAQAIYREWFVNFRFPDHENVKIVESELGLIPEGWKVTGVYEAVEVNPTTRTPKDTTKPFVTMQNLSNNSMLINGFEYRIGNSGSKFRDGDTLFARITPCLENGKTGYVQFLASDDAVAIGSTEFIVLRSKTLCPEFVYLMARSDGFRDNAIKSMTGASGRQRVQEACFKEYLLAHPQEPLLSKFRSAVAPMFRQVQILAQKNENLRQTRDLLLPKLVSGEVDVSELNIDVGGEF